MSYFLKIENKIIDTDQIVDIKYRPAHDADLTEGGELKELTHIEAELEITTTALETESEYAYDGGLKGMASKSKVITLKRLEAEKAWDYFTTTSDADLDI